MFTLAVGEFMHEDGNQGIERTIGGPGIPLGIPFSGFVAFMVVLNIGPGLIKVLGIAGFVIPDFYSPAVRKKTDLQNGVNPVGSGFVMKRL